MVNLATLYDCFTPQVGWKPTQDACAVVDLTDYDQSDSGLWYNDVPGVTLSLINASIDKDSADLREWIVNSQQSVVREVILDYLKIHKMRLDAKALIKHLDFGMKPSASIRDTVAKFGRFVGVRIKPQTNVNLAFIIEDLSFGAVLDMGGSTDLKLYLYTGTQLEKIDEIDVTIVDKTIKWQGVKKNINYAAFDLTEGDEYFLGYYEDELEGNAIRTQKACGSCGSSPVRKYGQHVRVDGFSIPSAHTYGDKSLPDIEHAGFTTETFGINLRASLGCELTTLFCDNANLFAKAMQLKMAIKFNWDVFSNANKSQFIHADAVTSKDDAQLLAEKYEIDYGNEVKSISLDFESLECNCSGTPNNILTSMGL